MNGTDSLYFNRTAIVILKLLLINPPTKKDSNVKHFDYCHGLQCIDCHLHYYELWFIIFFFHSSLMEFSELNLQVTGIFNFCL